MRVTCLDVIVAGSAVLWSAMVLGGCGNSARDGSDSQLDPVAAGNYQVYRFTSGTDPSIPVSFTMTEVLDTGFRRMVTNASGFKMEEAMLDAGTELLVREDLFDASGNVSVRVLFAPGEPLLPASTATGTQVSATVVETIGSTTPPSTSMLTRVIHVDGMESVTVPAGTFSALRLTTTVQVDANPPLDNVSWWVAGIGRVKILNTPNFTSTWELIDWQTEDSAGPLQNAPLSINTPATITLPQGNASFQLTAAGGVRPYHWIVDDASHLPLGLQLTSDGKLAGMTTVPGQTHPAIHVIDSHGASAAIAMTVNIIALP